MDQITLSLLAVVGFVVLAITQGYHIPEALVKLGWCDVRKSWAGRVVQRRSMNLSNLIASQILDGNTDISSAARDTVRTGLVSAMNEVGLSRGHLEVSLAVASDETQTSALLQPDRTLARLLRPWCYLLDEDAESPAGRAYLDSMGATYNTMPGDARLVDVLDAWIRKLRAEEHVPYPDGFLIPKDGNTLLASMLATQFDGRRDVGLVMCKGQEDESRVKSSTNAHPTDFEGFRVFRERGQGKPLQLIAIDDSCTSGRTMTDAIRRFNDFVARDHAGVIQPIRHAVFLIAVRSPEDPNGTEAAERFREAGVEAFALLSYGESDIREMSLLAETDSVESRLNTLKSHPFCGQSVRIWKTEPDQRASP
ncbi:MAG: hypothetical protein AAFX05_01305 [Planctomycetota bacterium]